MKESVLIAFFLVFGCCAVNAQTQAAGSAKVQRVAERSMEIKRMVVQDKSVDLVTVDGKQYKWFADRNAAVAYFNTMTVKYDMIVVYIDSSEPNPAEPDMVTISEPVFNRTE